MSMSAGFAYPVDPFGIGDFAVALESKKKASFAASSSAMTQRRTGISHLGVPGEIRVRIIDCRLQNPQLRL